MSPDPGISELIDQNLLAEVKRISLKSRRSVNGDLVGNYRSAFRGSGLVFSDIREYQPGDDIRHIHWKVTARTGRPFIKSFEEDRQLRIVIAADLSASTNSGIPKSKHRRILEFSALLTVLAETSHDQIGLLLFSDGVDHFIPLKASRTQSKIILSYLAAATPKGKKTDISSALDHLVKVEQRRSIIFLLSDFYSSDFSDSLKRISIRNDVVGVLFKDDLDYELPLAGIVEFQDPENDQIQIVDTSATYVRNSLKALQDERVSGLNMIFRRAGSEFIVVERDLIKPLRELMLSRTARE